MNEGRNSVLVAALSTYADLLAKSTSEVDLAVGKGKGKASDDDVDIQAERLDQLKVCGELIAEATTSKDKARTHGKEDSSLFEDPILGNYPRDRRPSAGSSRTRRAATPRYQDQTEEYVDPFTGLPIVHETGFEPGPSNKPSQPIRNFSWRSAAPDFRSSQHGLEQPAPLTRASSLPIEKKPLPHSRSSENASDWSPRRPDRSMSYPYSDRTSISSHSPRDSRTRRRVEERNVDEAENNAPNATYSGSYLSRISNLTSKAFKSAGNMLGLNQTQPVYDAPPIKAGSVVHVRRKSRDDSQFLMTSSQGAEKARKRDGTPPPAYDALSHGVSSTPTTFVDNNKPKNKKGAASSGATKAVLTEDEAFARALQEEEFREIQKERDMLLARSLANGTADDEDVMLAHFMAREYEDLIASAGKTGSKVPIPASIPDSKKPPEFDLSHWDTETQQLQLDHLYALEIEESLRAEELANDAGWAAAMKLQAEFDREEQNHEAWEKYKKSNFEECIVCGDENHKEEFLRPCEHGYCEGCLQEGFKNALASKTPFKCCKKNLNVDDCTGLGAKFVSEYKDLILELTTTNPMYCCNASCAKFLPPSAIVGEIGTCKDCKTQTCRHCKKLVHSGVFCEEDKETKAVKELAIQKGWKTCPGCNHLIERQSGCLHMICSRCQTAFCYRCSKRWNDCESTCPDPISASHPKFPTRN